MSDFDQNQEAHLSGLHIVAAKNHSNVKQQPQREPGSRHEQQQEQQQPPPLSCWWNQDVNQIPNLLEGRHKFGAVALMDNTIADHGSSEDSMNSVVVVVGGSTEHGVPTES